MNDLFEIFDENSMVALRESILPPPEPLPLPPLQLKIDIQTIHYGVRYQHFKNFLEYFFVNYYSEKKKNGRGKEYYIIMLRDLYSNDYVTMFLDSEGFICADARLERITNFRELNYYSYENGKRRKLRRPDRKMQGDNYLRFCTYCQTP